MFEFKDVPDTNIVELKVDGRITQSDFDAVIRTMEEKIEKYGHVAVLEDVRSIGAMPPAVLWDDLRWVFKHLKQISRAAVVADKKWLEKLVDLMQSVVSTEVRHFDPDEIDEARKWLRRTDN